MVTALADPRVTLSRAAPAMLTMGAERRFDVVDIASDFLNQSDANKFAFTVEAVAVGGFGHAVYCRLSL